MSIKLNTMNITHDSDYTPLKITGNWDGQAKLLKEKFPQLTDADLKYEPGKENDLVSNIVKRTKKGKLEVINLINKVSQSKS